MDETRSAERQGCTDAASDTLLAGGPLAVQPPGGYHRTLAGAVFQHVDVLWVLDALFRDGPGPTARGG